MWGHYSTHTTVHCSFFFPEIFANLLLILSWSLNPFNQSFIDELIYAYVFKNHEIFFQWKEIRHKYQAKTTFLKKKAIKITPFERAIIASLVEWCLICCHAFTSMPHIAHGEKEECQELLQFGKWMWRHAWDYYLTRITFI